MKIILYGSMLAIILIIRGVECKAVTYNNGVSTIQEIDTVKKKKRTFDGDQSIVMEMREVDGYLSADFLALEEFSQEYRSFEMHNAEFEQLFWNGLIEAIAFYESSESVKKGTVGHLVEDKLIPSVDNIHSINKPALQEPTLESAFKALSHFEGKWHGLWQSMKVHHLWLSVRSCSADIDQDWKLVGLQSCFTGDGFGWNYISEKSDKIVILGFVYHFNERGTTTGANAHYAFLNTNDQLTWVTENHIYHEFVCRDQKCTNEKHYVITGAQYEQDDEKPSLTTGFQAVYLSTDFELPDFRQFYITNAERAKSYVLRKLARSIKNLLDF